MHGRRGTILSRVALLGVMAALALIGCSEDIDMTLATDVNNRSFTFTNGQVLHPALTNQAITLSFTNNGTNFTLTSPAGAAMPVGTAVGEARFRPCSLTVDPNGSTYASFLTGPQADDVLVLSICDYDIKANVLILGNGTVTATSAPAVAL